MSIALDATGLNSDEWAVREQVLRRFEGAWRRGPRPVLEDYLPTDGRQRRAVLLELVHTDLEYRLKDGEPARVEEYLIHFPELKSDPAAELELITAELELRRRREPGLAIDEFLARFPHHAPELRSTRRGMHHPDATHAASWNCPQCHEPVEAPGDASPEVVACPSCGMTIRLDPGHFTPWPLGQSRLGKYELLEEVGRGTFGIVYRARDTTLDRVVALKILRAGRFASSQEVDRFLREARNAAQLEHPHIVAVHDAGRIDEACYLVGGYVEGTTLAARIAAGRLTFREAVVLVIQVAEAADYAHRRGVIHRDIKPSNILLDREERAYLTDFGLARREAGEVTMTWDGMVLGTPAYMSPEQARGEGHAADGRTDVYSLGVILYQLLTSELPFRGNTRMLLHQVLHEEPEPPRRLNDRIPKDLETICLKAMAREPDRRYPRAAALAEDLQRFLAGRPIHARPVGRLERLWRWCRRNPTLATTGGLAAAAIGVAVILTASFAVHRANAAQRAQRLSAELIVGRALSDCERGEVGRGMLWLARGLQLATTAQDDRLQRAIRANLAGWRRQIHPLKHFLPNHGSVEAAAFSPDGRTVLTGGMDGTARLWDAATGQPRGQPLRHRLGVAAAAFSPDGHTVLTGCDDGTARLWDAATGQPRGRPLVHKDRVRVVAFSPDGHTVLTGGMDWTARLWDAATGEPRGQPLVHPLWVATAAFSPDGHTVLTGCDDGMARLWDAATGRPRGRPLEHGAVLTVTMFSPDGRTVLTGGWDPDGMGRLWDAATGQPRGQPLRHRFGVRAASFSPDGSTVLTGGADKMARLWDAATGQPRGQPLRHRGHVLAVAFSPDGQTLLTGSEDGTARLWDAASGQPVGQALLHQAGVTAAMFSPDGSTVLTAGKEMTARLWEVAPDRRPRRPLVHDKGIVSIAYNPDGSTVLTGSKDGTARLWDAATGEPRGRPLEHGAAIWSMALSPDGHTVLTGGEDGTARLWDAATGEPRGRPLKHRGKIWSTSFSPDGRTVLTGGEDGTARLWDAATGLPRGQPLVHEGRVRVVALSPDGHTVLTGGDDGTARLWDAATGEPRGRPLEHGAAIWSMALSPDGRTALTGGADGTARLWDAATGEPRGQPLRHRGEVKAVVFSRDGATVLTGSSDRTARLWDVASGRPLTAPLMHEAEVYAVALSPDGRTALTGGEGNAARFWDAATGQPLGLVLVHHGFVDAVAFSPDGRTALTGSEDGAARFWEVPLPVAGEVEQILRWVEVLTGVQWDRVDDPTREASWSTGAADGEVAGVIRGLDAPAWHRLRQELQEERRPRDQHSGPRSSPSASGLW